MIDRRGRKVHTAGGTTVDYRALALATGSTPTRLPIDGADLPGVIHVRDREQRVELLHRTFPRRMGSMLRPGFIGGISPPYGTLAAADSRAQ